MKTVYHSIVIIYECYSNIYRRNNREAVLRQMGWKVNFEDVEISRKEVGRSSVSTVMILADNYVGTPGKWFHFPLLGNSLQ